MVFAVSLLFFCAGMLATSMGSRLAGRCATWCCALMGLPRWVVNATVVSLCVLLPQLMLAFLAAGLDSTALAVGCALSGAVTDVGLVFSLCFLRRGGFGADLTAFRHKCIFLALASGIVLLFTRDGFLSYTGTGLLMLLFVVFMLDNMAGQYRVFHAEDLCPVSTQGNGLDKTQAGVTADTTQFPAMSVRSSLRNLSGVLVGLAILATGALLVLLGAVLAANATGTIQALWAATLISLGFSLPLLAEVFHHPLGSVWKDFAERCRIYSEASFPMQVLNNAVLSITLALPLSSLMYRRRLPIGAQFRLYEAPICLLMAAILLVPLLLKKRPYRWQGAALLAIYGGYLVLVLLAPLSGA